MVACAFSQGLPFGEARANFSSKNAAHRKKSVVTTVLIDIKRGIYLQHSGIVICIKRDPLPGLEYKLVVCNLHISCIFFIARDKQQRKKEMIIIIFFFLCCVFVFYELDLKLFT